MIRWVGLCGWDRKSESEVVSRELGVRAAGCRSVIADSDRHYEQSAAIKGKHSLQKKVLATIFRGWFFILYITPYQATD